MMPRVFENMVCGEDVNVVSSLAQTSCAQPVRDLLRNTATVTANSGATIDPPYFTQHLYESERGYYNSRNYLFATMTTVLDARWHDFVRVRQLTTHIIRLYALTIAYLCQAVFALKVPSIIDNMYQCHCQTSRAESTFPGDAVTHIERPPNKHNASSRKSQTDSQTDSLLP